MGNYIPFNPKTKWQPGDNGTGISPGSNFTHPTTNNPLSPPKPPPVINDPSNLFFTEPGAPGNLSKPNPLNSTLVIDFKDWSDLNAPLYPDYKPDPSPPPIITPPPIVTPPPIITPPKPPKPPKPFTDPVTHVKRDHTPPDINDKWLNLYTNLIDSGKTDAEATESVNNTLKDYLDQLSSQALASSAPEPYVQEAMPELSEIQLLAIETNCDMLWKLAHLPIPQIIRILKSVRDRLRIQQDYERGNNALQFRKNKNYQGSQRPRRKGKIRQQRKTRQRWQ